jgi:hypothetical protein
MQPVINQQRTNQDTIDVILENIQQRQKLLLSDRHYAQNFSDMQNGD